MSQVPSDALVQMRERLSRRERSGWFWLIVGLLLMALGEFHIFFWSLGGTLLLIGGLILNSAYYSIAPSLRAMEEKEFGDHSDPNVRALLRKEISLEEYGKRAGIRRDV